MTLKYLLNLGLLKNLPGKARGPLKGEKKVKFFDFSLKKG